ncbi:MAG: DUF192 domain-containing protein, partial [Nitrospiria bacterium]
MKAQWIFMVTLCLSPVLMGAEEQNRTMIVLLPSGTQIMAEVADTSPKRVLGLMFRDQLPLNSGMLFIFEDADYHAI